MSPTHKGNSDWDVHSYQPTWLLVVLVFMELSAEERRCIRIIGIPENDIRKMDEVVIRSAFRRASRLYHPDSHSYAGEKIDESGLRVTFSELVYARDRLLVSISRRREREHVHDGEHKSDVGDEISSSVFMSIASGWTKFALRYMMETHIMQDRKTHEYYMRIGKIFRMEDEVRSYIEKYYRTTMRVYRIACMVESYFQGDVYVWSTGEFWWSKLYVPLWQMESYFEEENILFVLDLKPIKNVREYIYGDERLCSRVSRIHYTIDCVTNDVHLELEMDSEYEYEYEYEYECGASGSLGLKIGESFDVRIADVHSLLVGSPLVVRGVGPYQLMDEDDDNDEAVQAPAKADTQTHASGLRSTVHITATRRKNGRTHEGG